MKTERNSKYPPEYKRRIVELVRAGRTIMSVAAEYGVHNTTIRNWVRAADAGRMKNLDGVAPGDQTELLRLRDRVAELEEEREILKKAPVYSTGQRNTTTSDSWRKEVLPNAGAQTRPGYKRES